jgi:hypothetical protein
MVPWHFGRTGGIAGEADALHRLGLVSSYSAEPSGLLLPQTRRAKCQQGSSKKRRSSDERTGEACR